MERLETKLELDTLEADVHVLDANFQQLPLLRWLPEHKQITQQENEEALTSHKHRP